MPSFSEMFQRGEFPAATVARTVGFDVTMLERGRSRVTLVADMARHANPMGTLHGGILCDVADAAMGMAFASTLDDGESFTTLELKMNFVRPVRDGLLVALGTILQRGRTVGLAECRVTDERDRLIAHATSTVLVLRGDQAAGR